MGTLFDPTATSYRVVRLKNRFREPLFNGYRDALYSISIRLRGGDEAEVWHVCEVQLHLAAILARKEQSHMYYEYFRGYFKGNVQAVESRMVVLETVGKLCGRMPNHTLTYSSPTVCLGPWPPC